MSLYSEGQHRVGVSFNPSNNPDVHYIKTTVSELIDFMLEYGKDGRCSSIAVTEFESAAMWAVKSLTKEPNPGSEG
jgi:hypothetical protein